MTLSEDQKTKNAITLIAVVHNDVPASIRKTLYADYFHPVVSELESFIERKVNVVFASTEPQSSFEYRSDDRDATLQAWAVLGSALRNQMAAEGVGIHNLTKVMLLTHDGLNKKTAGVAFQAGSVSIASLRSYNTVGHETGHLLGATHEAARVRFKNGWWAETFMFPTPELIRSNAYAFSETNRQNIKNYLANWD